MAKTGEKRKKQEKDLFFKRHLLQKLNRDHRHTADLDITRIILTYYS
jgi:hypothetical protein